jgi:hypothetical protein
VRTSNPSPTTITGGDVPGPDTDLHELLGAALEERTIIEADTISAYGGGSTSIACSPLS